MMSEGFCGLHGRYQMTTAMGCPQCPPAPQIAPLWSCGPVSDVPLVLLRERDRYRDALKTILRLTEEIDDVNELVDEITAVAGTSLNESEEVKEKHSP